MNKLIVFTIKNKNGLQLKIINYGAIIIGLKVPDRNGNFIDIVVGLEDVANYIQKPYTNV